MLALEPLRGSNGDDRDGVAMGSFSIAEDDFAADEALLDDINFGDLFMGIDVDVLPNLELDPAEIFVEFSVGSGGEEDASSGTTPPPPPPESAAGEPAPGVVWVAAQDAVDAEAINHGGVEPSQASDRSRKPPPGSAPAAGAKGSSQGKRKAKVDWTPELHRRFVQAVEQLGIDKAVPSRILELMGIDCLTRHNIASHLQKYRSHRKHLLAREAEAASWSQRRQIYAPAGGGAAAAGAKREIISPWLAPTIGFPPPPPPPASAAAVPQAHRQAFRRPPPLHVWGHPTGEAAPPMVHMWLPQIAPRSPAAAWAAHPPPPLPPPLADPSPYWHHHYPGGIPHAVTPGMPCFPQPLAPARFPAAAQVPGIVPHRHPIYRAVPPPPMSKHSSSQHDAHPSIESIDAAIGDVFSKPWLPLPLGLKPPAADSVLVELQKQGVSKVPPAAACG